MLTGVWGPPMSSLKPFVDLGRGGSVVAAQTVGQDERGVAGEVGGNELIAVGGGNDDVDLFEERGDLLNRRECGRDWPGCIRRRDRSERRGRCWASRRGPAR